MGLEPPADLFSGGVTSRLDLTTSTNMPETVPTVSVCSNAARTKPDLEEEHGPVDCLTGEYGGPRSTTPPVHSVAAPAYLGQRRSNPSDASADLVAG